jgi:hypothetical protein
MAARSRKSLAAIESDSGFADAMSIIQNWLSKELGVGSIRVAVPLGCCRV